MGTRSLAQVAPTAGQIALNAYIYGYGGHSLVTPHAALKQLWWTDERIDAKVTRAFVVSMLRGEERDFLDKPLAFGEGLTDDTYMEWILDRAKRLFMILAEIGVPDQIFGCIDDSWDDDDLPLPLDNVQQLELSYENNEALNRKFYDTQFIYLLRELKQGAHVDYGPKEHIPMEYVNTLPPAVGLQPWDRVHFPGRSEEIFVRRKFPLTDKETGKDFRDAFMRDVHRAQLLPHEHIAKAWASYTSSGSGFVLSDFVGEHTLRTFIDHRTPMQFLRVSAVERPIMLVEWMHCLADSVAFLHHRGLAHTAISPSNIIIDHDNQIAFADIGIIRTFQQGKKIPKTESYDYAAPETHVNRDPVVLTSSPPLATISTFARTRKASNTPTDTSSSSDSSNGSSTRSQSINTAHSSPATPPSAGRNHSMASFASNIGTHAGPSTNLFAGSTNSFRNFSRHLATPSSPRSAPMSPTSAAFQGLSLPGLSIPSTMDPKLLRDLPVAAPEMSDVYSLACVYLDILTFMLKGKLNDFVKFRSTRVPTGKNKYRTDSSFHADHDKIYAWMDTLEADSCKRQDQVYRGVPEMLKLIRSMLAQNATLRPTALQVRDQLLEILVVDCGVETLCCAGRIWEESEVNLSHIHGRDSVSVATSAATQSAFLRRATQDTARSASAMTDHMSELSRIESNKTAKMHSRGSSTASASTAKQSHWRRAFTRSAPR